MLSAKEWYDKDFYSYCQQQYDEARRYLKTCGKPEDEVARFMISVNRETARLFGGMLDTTEKCKELQAKQLCSQVRIKLKADLNCLESYLAFG